MKHKGKPGDTRTTVRDGYGDWVPRLSEAIKTIVDGIETGEYSSVANHHLFVRSLYLGSSQKAMLDVILKTLRRVNHDKFAGAKRWHLMFSDFQAEQMMGSYRLTRHFIYRHEPSWNHFPGPSGLKHLVKDSKGAMAFPAVNFKPFDETPYLVPASAGPGPRMSSN